MCLSMSRAAKPKGSCLPPPLPLLRFFADESHFDDCQCDFNTIFQLDAKLRAWALSIPVPGGNPCAARAFREELPAEISDTQKKG